ncbi:hypothetical protein, partial [Nitrosomonas communis]|uniref:hypothetical protein n=1 Tax=Nitrosomonas communis TaxID=44574 RepID=UPI0026F26439
WHSLDITPMCAHALPPFRNSFRLQAIIKNCEIEIAPYSTPANSQIKSYSSLKKIKISKDLNLISDNSLKK